MIVERASLVIALIGCAPPPAPPEPARSPSPSPPASTPVAAATGPRPLPIQIPDEPAEWQVSECKASGGKMQKVCLAGAWECVVPYRDGGKRCSDEKDCIGECIYEGPRPAPAIATGTCQRDSNPCGCRAYVSGGHVQPKMCTD